MHKGLLVYIIVIAVIILLWYFSTGFAIPSVSHITTTISTNKNTTTTTISVSNTTNSTKNYTNKTKTYLSCSSVAYLYSTSFNSSHSIKCSWLGGEMGVWAASIEGTYNQVQLQNATNHTILNSTFDNVCPMLYRDYNLSAGIYTLRMQTGPAPIAQVNSSSPCYFFLAELNTTLLPHSNSVYTNVFNGNFSTGSYAGWNTTGLAFRYKPLDLPLANTKSCYPGNTPWNNYNGTYFASTYYCNVTTQSTGNLTSSKFVVTNPFLNFQIISYYSPYIYVEILKNNTPAIKAYFNTYRISNSSNQTFMLRNATIPLTTLYGKTVQIRLVVNEVEQHEYVVAGDFRLSSVPNQQPGILENITIV